MTRTLSALLLLASLEASAAQVLQGRPDDTLAATLSRAEPTLIRIEGHRIRRVFGAEGDFDVKADRESGTAFVKPTTDKPTLTAYVADDGGRTWKLLLSLSDGPADSIVIKGRAGEASGKPASKDTSRNQIIKRALLALDGNEKDEMASRVSNELVPLWRESLFVLVKSTQGPVNGEKYLLSNLSDKVMVIDERELYRRGVLAVALEKLELQPAETTVVYVISEPAE